MDKNGFLRGRWDAPSASSPPTFKFVSESEIVRHVWQLGFKPLNRFWVCGKVTFVAAEVEGGITYIFTNMIYPCDFNWLYLTSFLVLVR